MEEYIKPPPPLLEGENISKNWKIWKKNFMAYMKATNSYSKPKDVKVYILRNCIGEFGQRAIDKIVSKNSSCLNNMGILIQKLDEHFSNEVQERYKFFTSQKGTNESIINYIDNLKKKANSCNFGTMVNSLIRDKVLAEIKDKQLIEKLLYIRNLDLSKLTSIWLEHTIQKQNQLRSNQNDNTFNINENQNSITNRPKSIPHNRPCWKCGQKHPLRACPAWGSKCEKCSCYNHYTSHCQGLKNDNIQSGPSAPLPNFQQLYPDLNNDSNKVWSWVEEPEIKINENLQKSEAPLESPKTGYARNKQKEDSCHVS